MDTKIINHFKKADPVLFSALKKIENLPTILAREPEDYFISLANEIVSQQLSGKVANVIFDRFKNLFSNKKISPRRVIKVRHERLRSTGMSNAKARFIKDLADKIYNKEVILEKLSKLENEEVIKELTKIKGVGPWTADMFLMFTLGRKDVFSFGDLGLRNAIKNLYKLENPTQEKLKKITKKWIPYRTYACLILWKSLDLKLK